MTIMIIMIILVAIIRIDILSFVWGKLACACWQIPQTGDANCHPQPIGMCDNLTDVQPTWGFLKTHCDATGRMIYIWVTSEPLNIIFSWSSKTLSMLEQPFFFFGCLKKFLWPGWHRDPQKVCEYDDTLAIFVGRLLLTGSSLVGLVFVFLCVNGHFMGQEGFPQACGGHGTIGWNKLSRFSERASLWLWLRLCEHWNIIIFRKSS